MTSTKRKHFPVEFGRLPFRSTNTRNLKEIESNKWVTYPYYGVHALIVKCPCQLSNFPSSDLCLVHYHIGCLQRKCKIIGKDCGPGKISENKPRQHQMLYNWHCAAVSLCATSQY